MAKFCGNCGTPLNDTAIFCGGCGTRVPAAAAPPAPKAYTPVSVDSGFSPVPATFAPPVSPAAPAGFTPVTGVDAAPSAPYAPIPAAYVPPVSPAAPAGFTPVTGVDAAPSAPYAPIPAAYVPPVSPAAPAGFTPVTGVDAAPSAPYAPIPAAYVPPASPAAPAGFTPVTGVDATPSAPYAPIPAAYVPPASPAAPAGFTPVTGVDATPSAPYAPIPAAYVPPVSPAAPAGFTPVTGVDATPSAPYPQIPAAYAAPVSPAAPAGFTPGAGAAGAPYPPTPAAHAPLGAQPLVAYPAANKSNTLLKVVIAFVLIIFVGGVLALAGLWYAAVKIKAKVQTVASQVMDGGEPSTSTGLAGLLSNSSAKDNGQGGITGDPCRFLSKAEVSQAVGLPILRTDVQDNGCSYIAKGDPADVTAKHLSSMLSGMGADAQAQKMAQKFANGLFAQQEASDKDLSAEAAKGEIPVLTLVFTAGHAASEMKLNRGAFAHIGGTTPLGSGRSTAGNDLAGIGDEAYSVAGSMIMLRKGNVMARMMYVSCPCNTDNITPLARILASRL